MHFNTAIISLIASTLVAVASPTPEGTLAGRAVNCPRVPLALGVRNTHTH